MTARIGNPSAAFDTSQQQQVMSSNFFNGYGLGANKTTTRVSG